MEKYKEKRTHLYVTIYMEIYYNFPYETIRNIPELQNIILTMYSIYIEALNNRFTGNNMFSNLYDKNIKCSLH